MSSYEKNDFYSDFSQIILKINPQLIVEFGILDGYSLDAFVDCRNEVCEIHAYDLFDDFPFNAADFSTIQKIYGHFKNIKIEKLDFYKGVDRYKDESIDILHVDIANNGDVYKFAIENYMKKIKKGGVMLLEGGSKERDEVEWMNKFSKRKINPYIESIKDNFDISIIEKFPSVTIIKNKS